MNHVYFYRILRFLLVIFSVTISFVIIFYVSKLIYPFIIGLFIAFFINPIVNFFNRTLKFPRSAAVLFTLLIVFSALAGVITLLIVELVAGAEYLSKVVPRHIETLVDFIEQLIAAQIIPLYNQLTGLFMALESGQQEAIMNNIESVGSQVGTTIANFIQSFFEKIPNILSWFPNAATVVIFSLLGTFFISKDWQRFSKTGNRFLPSLAKTRGKVVFADLKKALVGFITAQATLISISTVIILIGLLILKVDYAITIAIITGLVDIIPYLGTGLIFIPWIIFEAIAGDMRLAVGLGVLYLVVIVQRQLMEPKILSSNIGIDPLATLIALFAGYKLFGFIGLMIGPIVLVIIKTLYKADIFQDLWKFIKGDESTKT